MDYEIELAQSAMASSSAWEKVLTQVGIPRDDYGLIGSIRVTCNQIHLVPS